MIDIPNDPEAPLGSWFITTATRSNTEFQSPAHIPNGSRCTVRSGPLLVWGYCMENIPANNEVEECLCLLERMETCSTWSLLVFQCHRADPHEDWRIITISVNHSHVTGLVFVFPRKQMSFLPHPTAWPSHEEPFPQKHTECCYYITHTDCHTNPIKHRWHIKMDKISTKGVVVCVINALYMTDIWGKVSDSRDE